MHPQRTRGLKKNCVNAAILCNEVLSNVQIHPFVSYIKICWLVVPIIKTFSWSLTSSALISFHNDIFMFTIAKIGSINLIILLAIFIYKYIYFPGR